MNHHANVLLFGSKRRQLLAFTFPYIFKGAGLGKRPQEAGFHLVDINEGNGCLYV